MRSTNQSTTELVNNTRILTASDRIVNLNLPHNAICFDALMKKLKQTNFMVLSYTNNVADRLNDYIRSSLFPEKKEWNVPEKIMVKKTFPAYLISPIKWDKQFLFTADKFRITAISECDRELRDETFKCYRLHLDDIYYVYKNKRM